MGYYRYIHTYTVVLMMIIMMMSFGTSTPETPELEKTGLGLRSGFRV